MKSWVFRPASLALAAAALSLPLFAEGPSPASPAPALCPAIDVPAPSRASARIRAFVDPATGRLRPPTAEELRQLAEARRQTRTGPERVFDVIVYPDGMKSVDLGDAFLFDLVMEKRPDGSTRFRCAPRGEKAPAGSPAAGEER